jgi:hypothetical protein
MRTLFLLVMLVLLPLFGGTFHEDALPALAAETGGGERCITDELSGPPPTFYEEGRAFVECIAIDDVTATFTNTYPVQIDLNVDGRIWQGADKNGSQIQVNQWRDGDDLYVSVYREITPISTLNLAPHSTTIALKGRFEAGSYTVHINSYSFEIAIPDAPPPGSDAPPLDDDDYPGGKLERRYAVIQDVDVIIRETYPARVALHVTGYHTDGCTAAVQIDQRRAGQWVFVEIYRLIDPAVRCSMTWNPLDEYIRLDGSFTRGNYIIQVNDHVQEVWIPYPPPPPPDERRYAVIENVEVLVHETYSYPARLTLHVTGYEPDGCRSPLQIDQRRERDWVIVEIYRLVSPAILCPEMLVRLDEYIPLDGRFEYGTYIIQVNDYIFPYTIPPVPLYDDVLPPGEPALR